MKKIIIIAWILIVITTLVYFILHTDKKSNEIRIGVISVLTGDDSVYGIPPLRGIELATEKINSEGGINGKPIRLIVEDDFCSPQPGVNAAKKLILRNKVKVIIGAICSSSTMAIAPLANEHKVILLSPQSAAPQIRDAGEFIFRNWPASSDEGKIAADLAFSRLKYNNSALIFINNDYGVGIKEAFKKSYLELGGKILIEEGINEGDNDYRTIIAKIKQQGPDFVYLATYLREGALFLTQAREIGLDSKILAPDSLHDIELVKLAGTAAEGIIVTTVAYNPDSNQDNIKQFVDDYKSKYKETPNNYAAHGFDALLIIKQAISEVGYDSEAIRDYLHKLKDFPGVSGTTSFDDHGDVIKDFSVTEIREGKFIEYK